jgi:hypothetical protein
MRVSISILVKIGGVRLRLNPPLGLSHLCCVALSLLGAAIMPSLCVADDVSISQGLVLEDEGIRFNPIAMTLVKDDVYVIAGRSIFGESALGVRLLKGGAEAKVLWRYTSQQSRQLADAAVRGPAFGGAADMPDFRGVAASPDQSVLLCGYGVGGAAGKDRSSLLTRIESSGRVASEKMLLPPKFTDPPQDHPLDPNNLGEVVLSGFDDCFTWGDKVGIVGQASHFFPSQKNLKIRESRPYDWIVMVDMAGEVVWQKLIPLAFGLRVIGDLTSVLVTPQGNLLFTRHWAGQSEILSVSQTGELIAAKHLKGFWVAVHPTGSAKTIQLFGGDPKDAKTLLTLGEDLQEIRREDGLEGAEFIPKKAYGLADSSLLLAGEKFKDGGTVSAICYVSASREITTTALTHGSFFDAGTAKVSALTGRPGEILIARTLLEQVTRSEAKRIGVTLDLIKTSKN